MGGVLSNAFDDRFAVSRMWDEQSYIFCVYLSIFESLDDESGVFFVGAVATSVHCHALSLRKECEETANTTRFYLIFNGGLLYISNENDISVIPTNCVSEQ